jgi:hypothetical protein
MDRSRVDSLHQLRHAVGLTNRAATPVPQEATGRPRNAWTARMTEKMPVTPRT